MFICGFWETHEKKLKINSHRLKWALLLELVCLKLNTIKRQRIYHQLWHQSDEDVMVNSINTYKYVALEQLRRKIAFVSPAVIIIFVSTQSVMINYLVLGQKSSANKQKNVIRVPASIQKYGEKNSRSAKSDCGKSIFTLMLLFSIILRIQNFLRYFY